MANTVNNNPTKEVEQIVEEYLLARVQFFVLCGQAATNNKFNTALYLVFNHLYKLPLQEIVAGIEPVRKVLNDIRNEVQYSDQELDEAHFLLSKYYPGIVRNPESIPYWLDDLLIASEVVLPCLEALRDGEIIGFLNSGRIFSPEEKNWLSIRVAEKMYYARVLESPESIY
ncbi:MAG TPA: hypothetical protein PLV82_04065 [bacterium]|nr:hypothetical protein [bacterium]